MRLLALALLLSACGNDVYTDATVGYDARPVNTTCKALPRPASGAAATGLALTPVFSSVALVQPLAMLQAPGDGDRFYVVEQGGTIVTFSKSGTDATVALSFPSTDITAGGETGLLGLAFAPDWQTSHTAYTSRTAPGGSTGLRSVLARIRSTDGGLTFDRATEQEILTIEQPFSNHNGGWIAFGPDGFLYAGFGDGGSGGDPLHNGQNLDVLLGKMLRIDPSNSATYAVPADNPFVGVASTRPEIWAYGLRNPWRWSFDRGTGQHWVGDVGQNAYEEVDVVTRGGNYGWNTREGLHCYGADTCASTGFVDPVAEYTHADGQSITGGYVYRGSAVPALFGTYVYADYVSGKLWGLFPDEAGVLVPQLLLETGLNISSFAEDCTGELYAIDLGGRIYRFESSDTPGAIGFPQKLSRTGCVDPAAPQQPSAGLVPYAVNAPFWSDGAEKTRFIGMPAGQTATLAADGDLDFPIGTVLEKTFRVGGKLVETRLFMRHADGGWAGYTYAWDADEKDATLVVGGRQTTLPNGQGWSYPSSAQCLQCHTTAAGASLGLELQQLARTVEYPETKRRSPQLATLAAIGIIPTPPATTPLPVPYGTGVDLAHTTLEQRARAWLHTNCAGCHRPQGGGVGPDLRYDRTLAETRTCNVDPIIDALGIAGAKIIAPGAPDRSVLSSRIHRRDAAQMPPLASLVPDAEGAQLVDDWIRSLTSCP